MTRENDCRDRALESGAETGVVIRPTPVPLGFVRLHEPQGLEYPSRLVCLELVTVRLVIDLLATLEIDEDPVAPPSAEAEVLASFEDGEPGVRFIVPPAADARPAGEALETSRSEQLLGLKLEEALTQRREAHERSREVGVRPNDGPTPIRDIEISRRDLRDCGLLGDPDELAF